jgi:chemotaxis protein methyltransferase CheR
MRLPVATAMPPPAEDDEAYRYIADLVYDRCRIQLHRGKEALIKARLAKLMRRHGFAELTQYCDFLQSCAQEQEFTRVVDALTTNFTNFLREADHFEFLVSEALPSMLRPGRKQFRIWSAASSTGEEPYTIAFYLLERFPPVLGWDWRVTGSDISTRVLEKARLGIYSADRVGTVPLEWLRKYFQQGIGAWARHYRVKRGVAAQVVFQQINLIHDYAHPWPFEVIFCRNVMIYFDRPTQQRLVQRLCRSLVPHGYLIIGHSESLNGLRAPLRCLRPSIYQRTGP